VSEKERKKEKKKEKKEGMTEGNDQKATFSEGRNPS